VAAGTGVVGGCELGARFCAFPKTKARLRKETGKRILRRRPIHHPTTGLDYSAAYKAQSRISSSRMPFEHSQLPPKNVRPTSN
jgi:hypothetical protein